MSDDPARAWIERVLGVQLPAKGPAGTFGKAFGRWRNARTEITAHLAAFRTALLADEAVKADPRASFVAAAAAEIPRMLPDSSREVEALLQPGSADRAAAGKALAAIAEYRRALDAATGLAKLEAFASRSLKFPLAVRKTMAAALDDIETTLRAAA